MHEDLAQLRRDLETLQHWMVDTRERLASAYGWTENDARLTLFNKVSHVATSTALGVVFMEHDLTSPAWWINKTKTPVTREVIQSAGDEFNMFLRISFIQACFYAVESSFRVFTRALDADACARGCAEFKSVYEWVLKRLGLQPHRELLDLVRNIRNVMHNNGLFFPSSGEDANVTYQGVTYAFVVGQPNDFVTWPLVVSLAQDLGAACADMVETDELREVVRIDEPS